MKKRLFTTCIFVLACVTGLANAQDVKVAKHIPYQDDAEIQSNVRQECTDLGSKLARFIQEYAKAQKITVSLVDRLDTGAEGRVLKVEITDAVSMGNAFTGHHKFTAVRGELYENGELISSFRAKRNSMGGAFAGYKGSCSVLGRTTKVLGKDIASWLTHPAENARLGDY